MKKILLFCFLLSSVAFSEILFDNSFLIYSEQSSSNEDCLTIHAKEKPLELEPILKHSISLTGYYITLSQKTISYNMISKKASYIKNGSTYIIKKRFISSDSTIRLDIKRTIDKYFVITESLVYQNISKKPIIIIPEHNPIIDINHLFDTIDMVYPTGNIESYSKNLLVYPNCYKINEDPSVLNCYNNSNDYPISIMIWGQNNENKSYWISVDKKKDKIIEYFTDKTNKILNLHERPSEYIYPWTLPSKSYQLTQKLYIKHKNISYKPIILTLGWYPKSNQSAFCLQVDDIFPNNPSNDRIVNDIMLNKIHNLYPLMKMQTIIVVDNISPYDKITTSLSEAPIYCGPNDLNNNKEYIKKYVGWLSQYSTFFKIQTHALHHTPVNKPAGFNNAGQWEFSSSPFIGSGHLAEDYDWMTKTFHRMKSEIELLNLGEQLYFKSAGYRRTIMMPRVLAEQGYKIWDFHPGRYYVRNQYISPSGHNLWIMASGPAIDNNKEVDKYWDNIDCLFRRGYPYIVSGHTATLTKFDNFTAMTTGWSRMYEKYHIWNAWPDEMADYWTNRSKIQIKEISDCQYLVTNTSNKHIKDATVNFICINGFCDNSYKILVDKKKILPLVFNNNCLSICFSMKPFTQSVIEIK